MSIETFLERWFDKKISLKKIEHYCRKLGMRKRTYENNINSENIRVSCVQRQIQPVKNIERYIDILNDFVKRAVEKDSRIIVFPEYNFFDLLGLIPGFSLLNRYLNKKALRVSSKCRESNKDSNNPFVSAVFSGISRPVEKGIKKIVSLLAEGYGLYIYTGSYLLKEKGKIYNAGSLFGPDGHCIGTQKKIHLTDFEERIGIERGTEMEVYTLPFGKVVFPICMDATYFETFQIARELGADLVILPIANMEEYSMWKALRGIWPRVQESYVYGLKASLNGWVAGMHFTGKAGIFAPLSITPNKDGVVALSPHHEGNFLITGGINIKRLYEARNRAEYHGDKNPEFERGYLEKAYFRVGGWNNGR